MEKMTRPGSIVDPTTGRAEYASGRREIAREEFFHYLRSLDASTRKELEIVESSLRISPTHSLQIRQARLRQKLVDSNLKLQGPITQAPPTAPAEHRRAEHDHGRLAVREGVR